MHDPIQIFIAHWRHALERSPLKQKSAVCVSTIGRDGFPNSRFVDLKEADTRGLVFCTYLDSPKGQDISLNSKAGLTVWWDHIGIQARFQGSCVQISDEEADRHWKSRPWEAQLTSVTFHQSQPLHDPSALQERLKATRLKLSPLLTTPRTARQLLQVVTHDLVEAFTHFLRSLAGTLGYLFID